MNQKQRKFIDTVWKHYQGHQRDLPWRQTRDPYEIMVSEVMLQQTQAQRVTPKYSQFLARFPTIGSLAQAPLSDVLHAWQGLGYNRRGVWLHQAAKNLSGISARRWSIEKLQSQKGIGHNTAAAIVVYAYNEPLVFIETNIRTVFIHHFFADDSHIDDRAIEPLVQQTLDTANPREWYWALMDYGVYVKTLHKNPSRRSKHYAKQTRYEGSLRQLRSRILREILAAERLRIEDVRRLFDDERVEQALDTLVADGLLQKHKQFYSIPLS